MSERADRSIFATLAGGRRIWAVASIHGEARRLATLHERLADRLRADDRIVYLGNILGRGPDVRGTIEEILVFRRNLLAWGMDPEHITFLRGSQEEMWQKLLQLQFAPNPKDVLRWMIGQGVGATLAAYGATPEQGLKAAADGAVALNRWTGRLRDAMRSADGHNQLLAALRRAAFTEDGGLLFVNAGIDPSRPLSAQNDSFWWGAPGFSTLSQPYAGFAKVIRGFDPKRPGLAAGAHTVSLDGGSGFGGPLLAACFAPSGEVVETIEA